MSDYPHTNPSVWTPGQQSPDECVHPLASNVRNADQVYYKRCRIAGDWFTCDFHSPFFHWNQFQVSKPMDPRNRDGSDRQRSNRSFIQSRPTPNHLEANYASRDFPREHYYNKKRTLALSAGSNPITSSKWAVCTTIHKVTAAIEYFADVLDWAIVVVGDQVMDDSFELSGINAVYLDAGSQVEILSEYRAFLELLPWRHLPKRYWLRLCYSQWSRADLGL